MMNKLNSKTIFQIAFMAFFGLILSSCEPEIDRLGEQLFTKTELVDESHDIIAYNINNNDTVRADNSELGNVMLGAFTESVFGTQKAEYVSQVRLRNYAPDFGTNAVLDSAVLVIKPLYDATESTETVDDEFDYPDGNGAATKKVITYSVHTYGNLEPPNGYFTLNVQEVTSFLGGTNEPSFSNRVVELNPTIIGTAKFRGEVSSATITRNGNNETLYSQDVSFRIPLDVSFFQSKIIDKQGSVELSDGANFVRYFKGLKISVEENDGYLFGLDPTGTEVRLYYKYDNTNNGVTTRVQTVATMGLGAGNAQIGQYTYNRTDTPVANAMATINTVSGDERIYLQGMGGPSAGFRIPDSVVSSLKQKYHNDKTAIMGAFVRVYTDSSWNNGYEKPSTFVFLQKNLNAFMPEFTAFSAIANYSTIKMSSTSDSQPYYDIVVTQTLKNIVEADAENNDFLLHIGTWRMNTSTGAYYGYQYDTRAYTPTRTVLVGTNPASDKRIKLYITYAK